MKLIAVSRVRNEEDIVEAFVRHHCAHFNKLIILDDGSNDNTLPILRRLQAEGLPLVVLSEESVVYDQARHMTSLLHIAVDQFGADWIMPLDADEFVEPAHGRSLAEIMAQCQPQLFSVAWSNFVWTSESNGDNESNPVLRLRSRLPPSASAFTKVLVPALCVNENVQLSPGNHLLLRDGETLPSTPLDAVQLCHFPVRSPLQYAGKIAIGYLKYVALAGWNRGLGFHYIEPFQSLLVGGMDGLERRMAADSNNYSLSNDERQGQPSEVKDAPLAYRGGPLVLTPTNRSLVQNVLQYAESLARELASIARPKPSAAPTSEVQPSQTEILPDEHATRVQILQQLAEDNAALQKRISGLELELLVAREVIFVQSERLSSRTVRLLDHVHNRLTNAGLSPRKIANCVFWLLRVD